MKSAVTWLIFNKDWYSYSWTLGQGIYEGYKSAAQRTVIWKINIERIWWYGWCCVACHLFSHGDVIKWKHFPRNWSFVRGIHRSPVNSPQKGQWRGALMFSLICTWIKTWANNCEASDFRRHCPHYDVIVMYVPTTSSISLCIFFCTSGWAATNRITHWRVVREVSVPAGSIWGRITGKSFKSIQGTGEFQRLIAVWSLITMSDHTAISLWNIMVS